IGSSASAPSTSRYWRPKAEIYDVLGWPDRASPEHPSNTVTQVVGLNCYQRSRLNRAEPPPSLLAGPSGGGFGDRAIGEAADFRDVHPLHADEPGRAVAPRRMEHAGLIVICHAGGELVVPGCARGSRLAFVGGGDHLPIGHHRLARRLAVDRPGRPVVVRRAVLGAF